MPGAECRSLSIFQIDCLVSSLNKKNSRAAFAEIYQLCAQNSSATERHLLCSLFSNIDLSQCDTKKSSKDSPQDRSQGKPGASSVTKNSAQHPLLAIVTKLLNSVSFTSGLAAGLTLTHATKAEVSLHFQRWFLSRLSDFVKPLELANQECSLSEAQEQLATLKTGLLEDIGVEVLHFLLMHLLLPSNPYHLTPVATSTLRRVLREGFQDSRVPLVLSCCLSLSSDDNTNDADEELTSEAWFPDSGLLRALTAPSCPVVDRLAEENVDAVAANVGRTHEVGDSLLADVIEELGFAATSTLDAVKLVLSEFEPEDVTPAAVARCLCMFMQTASGRGQAPPSHHQTENLTDLLSTNCNSPGAGNRRLDNLRVDEDVNEWNLDNFLAGVHDFNANLSLYQVACCLLIFSTLPPTQIILELDCPRFYVQDHAGFMLLKRFLLYETRDHELPVELFYRPWNNAPGQLSFLQQCSLHPDTNCLTYWPFTCVDLEGFKLSSEDKSAAVQIWKNVDYVKALLNISTRGLFAEVRGLFMRAFNLCPDIFTATLLETPHMPPLKCSMLSLAFARFLLPRPNSQILLQTAWSGCQKNLSACERQLLRGHLLAAALQLMHSWTCNINGLNNSNLEPASDTPPQPTFFNLIEVVMRIQGNPVMPLAMLLGSRNRPVSIAVCQLWPTVDVSAIESCEGSPVHRLAPPPVPLLLDLALCVVVYMVDAVKTLMDAASSEGHSQHRQLQLSAIQSSLDSFLTNWFVEQMTGEKEDVDLFCVQLVDYLRRRYPTLADALAPPAMPISTQAPPPPLPSTVADPNRHLPDHLRQPGYALIRHVINSARKALRSPSICVSPKVAAEAHQALAFFLQNLARIYCLPGTSTAGSCVAADQGSTVVASPHHLHPPVSTSAWTHPKEASAARSAIAVGLSSLVQRLPQTGLMSGPVQPPCAGGGTPLSPPIYLSFSNDPIELDLPTDVEFQVNSFFVKLLQAVNTPEEMLKVAYDYATSDSANQKKYLDGILRMLAYEVSRHLHDYPEHVLKPITELYGGVLATVASHLSVPALSMLWRAFLTRLYLFQPDTPVDSHLYAGVVRVLMKAKPTLVRYANLTSHLINCPIFKLFPADLREQPQQQVQPLNRQQQQQPMFSQVAPMTGVPQQALPSVSVAAYNVGAATSGAIGGAGSASHVVSATQMMNHHQPRDAAQSASLSSAGGLLLRYEDVDLATVRSCINVDELIQQIAVYSQSSSQNAGGGGGSSSAAAAAMSAMALLHSEPSIRQLILPAIEKAVNELITPLFERCCLITVPTVETVVRKDFALQPDPAQMLRAAKQMVRHLAASVSLITAREALSVSLGNNLTNIIWNSVKPASQQEKEAVEFIAMLVVSKSMHVCLAYMQKTVAERAVREVEKKLEPDVKMRQELGPRRFLEQVTAAHQSLPECVQSHPFVLRPMRPTVYQEFERSIPGFAPSAAASLSPGCIVPAQPSSQAQQQILQRATGLIAQQPPPNTSATSSQQQQQQKMAVAAAAHLLLQQQQQHQAQQQYLQQHSGTSAASQQPAPPIGGLFDTVVVHIRRHLGAIRSWLASSSATAAGTFPQDSPMVRSLQNLIESAQLAKTTSSSNSGSGGESAGVRLIATLVQSLLTHYRPSRWADQPGGLQAMEHLKEAHMITLRHLLSCEQSSWVARQVTCQWIQLPDGDLEPSSTNIQPASYASRVEHLSTLATIAMAKSAQTAVSSAGNAGASDEASANDAGIVGSKWNWEAFAELLKVHVIYLTQIDAYLAGKIASGHQAATTFVLNLLDHFVLPSLMGTSSVNQVGSGSATASQGVTDTSSTPMAGTIAGVSSSPSNPTANPNSSVASLLGSLSNTLALINSKREFTVLNEYDFWLTIHALQAHQRNTLISPGDTNLRLRLSCARIRALLDWGLLGEQSVVTLCPPTAPETSALFAGCSRAREFDDTPQMKAKTETFFRWWSDFYRNQNVTCENESLVDQVINNLANLGVLSVDENLTRFFRLATIYVVERALSTLKIAEQAPPNFSSATRVNGYYELDAYARLISITISRIGARSETATEGNRAKFALLNKVLGIIGGTLLQGHEVRPELFHAMPFQRILVRLFVDLYAMCGSVKETSSGRSEGEESTGLTLLEYVPLAYGNLLHMLRPERATNFIFAWLEIVAHREFVDQTLGASRKDGVSPTLRAAYRAVYAQLLVDILKFLSFYLQNALLPKPIACLYTATFRLCLVLFHDFPDFVTEYCVLLSNIVPSDSLQLRNLLLSAEPRRGVPSTDPLNVSSRHYHVSRIIAPPVDQLSQLEDPSGYCMEAGERLPPILRGEIDTYLTSRAPVKLLSELVTMLRLTDSLLTFLINPPGLYTSALAAATAATQTTRGEHDGGEAVSQEAPPQPQGKKAKKAAAAKAAAAAAQQQAILSAAGQQANAAMLWSARATQHLSTFGLADNLHYNVELMMNVVLYICITAVKTLRETGMPLNMTTVAHTPQMDIIQSLVLNLDNEGRYLLLNCMANQLRYPNSHTYYFSYTILYLFAEQSKEQVKEQISRVLMERLIVNRPHPWGLLMTSAELLRNPVYRFWEHEFARCHKDMEDIVTIVARSCISNFNPPTGAAPQSSSSSASQQQQTALATGGASQPPSGSLPRNPQHPSPGDSKPAATLTS
ncbi:unnamed protein product [Mesocestoides corti]|uniref:CCR4-NOT transcription complex subunit 1 n=1 Tax=Mesocestoides corti TaxID=53468 RepID=A0A158QT29_MESCO|nr:unnamed protein product [Mesocestoides corti]